MIKFKLESCVRAVGWLWLFSITFKLTNQITRLKKSQTKHTHCCCLRTEAEENTHTSRTSFCFRFLSFFTVDLRYISPTKLPFFLFTHFLIPFLCHFLVGKRSCSTAVLSFNRFTAYMYGFPSEIPILHNNGRE